MCSNPSVEIKKCNCGKPVVAKLKKLLLLQRNIFLFPSFFIKRFMDSAPGCLSCPIKTLTAINDILGKIREVKKAIVKNGDNIRIIIGTGGIGLDSWISTEEYFLNLLKKADWENLFLPNSIDAILAEHVWEHLTIEDGETAAAMCHIYLKKGGYVRLAVPDGLHPDPEYINKVKVDGSGPGSDDHKVLYTYKTLSEVFQKAGFRCELLEYFDELGEFHYKEWDTKDGMIRRSMRYDPRNKSGDKKYTSLVVDFFKD